MERGSLQTCSKKCRLSDSCALAISSSSIAPVHPTLQSVSTGSPSILLICYWPEQVTPYLLSNFPCPYLEGYGNRIEESCSFKSVAGTG